MRPLESAISSHPAWLVEGGGFEPPKAEPSDLQSDPFGHSGTPPRWKLDIVLYSHQDVNIIETRGDYRLFQMLGLAVLSIIIVLEIQGLRF